MLYLPELYNTCCCHFLGHQVVVEGPGLEAIALEGYFNYKM